MVFTPVEIIALIIIAISVIKIAIILVNPGAWMNFAKKIYVKPDITSIVALILGGVVLWYLLESGITIIEIFAVTAFVALLIMVGLAKEIEPLMKKYEGMVKKGNLWKEYWLYTLIWAILLAWGIKELFFPTLF
jgi:hypothetical protein